MEGGRTAGRGEDWDAVESVGGHNVIEADPGGGFGEGGNSRVAK